MFNLIYKWTDKIKSKVAELSKKLGEKGQGLTEYALILAAIAVIAVISVYNANGLKGKITAAFDSAKSNIENATPAVQTKPTT